MTMERLLAVLRRRPGMTAAEYRAREHQATRRRARFPATLAAQAIARGLIVRRRCPRRRAYTYWPARQARGFA